MEWCIPKRFSPQGRGLSANSSERYAAKQNHSKGTLLRKLKKGYVRSAPPSGGPPVTVEGQGGQNQLYERSTENDVFQMKTERKTEGKIPPQIFGKGRAGDPSPYEQKTEEAYILKPLNRPPALS